MGHPPTTASDTPPTSAANSLASRLCAAAPPSMFVIPNRRRPVRNLLSPAAAMLQTNSRFLPPAGMTTQTEILCPHFGRYESGRAGPPFRVSVLPSSAKVQFDRIDQRHEPRQQRLVRRMLHVSIERSLVLELHDAAKCIAFPSRRNVWAYMSLKKSRDYPLESGN